MSSVPLCRSLFLKLGGFGPLPKFGNYFDVESDFIKLFQLIPSLCIEDSLTHVKHRTLGSQQYFGHPLYVQRIGCRLPSVGSIILELPISKLIIGNVAWKLENGRTPSSCSQVGEGSPHHLGNFQVQQSLASCTPQFWSYSTLCCTHQEY